MVGQRSFNLVQVFLGGQHAWLAWGKETEVSAEARRSFVYALYMTFQLDLIFFQREESSSVTYQSEY